MSEYEQKVDVVFEALRNACPQTVYDALTLAPSNVLLNIQNMTKQILEERENESAECHCDEPKH